MKEFRTLVLVLMVAILGSSYVEAKPKTRNTRKAASKFIKKTGSPVVAKKPRKARAKKAKRVSKRISPKKVVAQKEIQDLPVQSFLPEFFKLQSGFKPALRLEGVGKNRSLLLRDPGLLAHVREKYVESSWFGALRQPDFGTYFSSCSSVLAQRVFLKAAQGISGRVSPIQQNQIEALVDKENFCTNRESYSGCDGWCQFASRTARAYGLRATENPLTDERHNPELAVPAATRHLQDLYDQFKDWGLAYWGYHSGSGVPAGAVRVALGEGMASPITMDKLMFIPTPELFPQTYAYMRKAAQTDFSVTYPYGVMAFVQIREHKKTPDGAEWLMGLWREHQLSLEPGNATKYASKWEAFTDWQGGTRVSNPGVKLVAKTTSPILPVQLSNVPSQELLGLYYYFSFELKEWEMSKGGKYYGEVPLVRWSRVDFVLDLRGQSVARTARIKELVRQLGMYGVLGYDQEGQSLKVALDPKMKIWGLSMYSDNHPEQILN